MATPTQDPNRQRTSTGAPNTEPERDQPEIRMPGIYRSDSREALGKGTPPGSTPNPGGTPADPISESDPPALPAHSGGGIPTSGIASAAGEGATQSKGTSEEETDCGCSP